MAIGMKFSSDYLRSGFKVSSMGWEVKIDVRYQATHGL